MIAALRVDLDLAWSSLRAGGAGRAVLVAGCTALVAGLLMIALTVVRFGWASSRAQERVSDLVADDGVRGGYVLALLLICLAPLTLLRQVVRLGTATREQRLAALRLAGATTGAVRRIGALEVGLPALVGGVLGYPVFLALSAVFGGAARAGGGEAVVADPGVARQLRLIPSTVHPAWWEILLVVLVVGVLAVLAGAVTSRAVRISPLGVTRRAPRAVPRPWALALVLPLFAWFASGTPGITAGAGDLLTFGAIGLFVLSLLALAPWVACGVGYTVAAFATSLPVLMAGRRLATDPRPAGRAAAAVGAIAVVAGGAGVVLAGLPDTTGGGFAGVDPFYLVPLALTGTVLLLALLLAVFSMAVHGVESLSDHTRSVASLSALGASRRDLEAVQRWEVGLVAVPVAVIGVVLGSAPALYPGGEPFGYAWVPLLVDGTTVGLVWVAVLASSRLTRPWLVRAASPLNLRTP